MKKHLWLIGSVVLALFVSFIIWYFLLNNDAENFEKSKNAKNVELAVEPGNTSDSESLTKETKPKQSSLEVEDMRDLGTQEVATQITEAPEPEPEEQAVPADLLVYLEQQPKNVKYRIKQYDENGEVIGSIAVLKEEYKPDGEVVVTLVEPNGDVKDQKKAVIDAEKRGYSINLEQWDYSGISRNELQLMFEQGDKMAGFQLGALLLEDGKVDEAESFLVAAAKKSGFSRPLDMLTYAYLEQQNFIEAAAWGAIASGFAGFDDWSDKIKPLLMQSDMERVEQKIRHITQKYQFE